jgi:bacterioferritin (cytochrome b1)
MSLKSRWWEWCRDFLGIRQDRRQRAVEILQQQYVEGRRRASHLTRHAQDMPYPHFRAKLLSIAADETEHCDQIAEKIKLLGGTLPAVSETPLGGGNSWRALLTDLEEQRRSAGELWEHQQRIQADFPEIADLLQRVYENGGKHRAEITAMLMRSDPQAFSTG